MSRSKQKKEHGFTLLELLIATAISLIILGALTSTFVIQGKTYAVQEQITEMVQIARAATDMISREVKMAGYDPAGAGIVGIPYSAWQLQIITDLNGDGSVAGTNENIIYTFDYVTNQIKRETGSGPQTFAENIQTFAFDYLNSAGTPTTLTAEIRQIRLTITVLTSKPDSDYKDNGGYRTKTLISHVTPHNL